MSSLRIHFRSILLDNYDMAREVMLVRFDHRADRAILPFTVGFVDGFSKMLILQSIVAMIHKLDPWCLN